MMMQTYRYLVARNESIAKTVAAGTSTLPTTTAELIPKFYI